MSNSYDCKSFSHTSYTIHTNHHHHICESPKQYYSIQLSHTSNNNNIDLPSPNIITATSLTKISRDWYVHIISRIHDLCSYVIGHAHRRDFSYHTHSEPSRLQVTPSWPHRGRIRHSHHPIGPFVSWTRLANCLRKSCLTGSYMK